MQEIFFGTLGTIWHNVFELHWPAIVTLGVLGAVIASPAIIVRIVLGLGRGTRDWAPSQLRAFLHFAMIGLIYPAVLGSILFGVLPGGEGTSNSAGTIGFKNLPFLMLEFAIIAHYCYDYIFVFNRYNQGDRDTNMVEFFIDVLVVTLLYVSAKAVNISQGSANLQTIAGAFFTLYSAYVVWDMSRREFRDVMFDAPFAVLYFVFVLKFDWISTQLGDWTPVALAALTLFGALYLALLTGRITANPARD